jgi:hypothetical protein
LDKTLHRERIAFYKELITQYESIKIKDHPHFKSVIEWARIKNICKKSFFKFYNRYKCSNELEQLLPNKRGPKPKSKKSKEEEEEYKRQIFSILHSPPKDFGFNRTTWRISDLHKVVNSKNQKISRFYLTYLIKSEGYRFTKARTVLTSTDPNYREKLKKITDILSSLTEDEKFFSIDEFGPVAIKIYGGNALTKQSEIRIVPQFQKTKGSLILTAALELSTNQITHFYSQKKNTDEMTKLLELLTTKYNTQRCLFLSWDAASWHVSKKLFKVVDDHNQNRRTPRVELTPLPAHSQFLNVIESVFSGMARAIIHNSNYQSIDECKEAIDKYLCDRNKFYADNPKRAGNKIWGKERVEPKFHESNNCKDPKYSNDY